MSDNLELPRHVSADGREIWDWAERFSRVVLLQDEARRVRQKLALSGKECGGCQKWMTRACPREVHDNRKGRSVGPSMKDYVCSQFAIDTFTARHAGELKARLAEIEAQLLEAAGA